VLGWDIDQWPGPVQEYTGHHTGWHDVRLVPAVSAVHDARRASRSHWRHRAWHLRSVLRYLCTTWRSATRRSSMKYLDR